MATSSMAPSLYQAPTGEASNSPDYPTDVGPEGIEIEIALEGDTPDAGIDDLLPPPDFDENLAESMDEGDLRELSSDLLDLFDQDTQARADWAEMYVKGMEVLGMKYEERTEPWSGACGVFSTILTEAAIRFQADMITETFPAAGPVKTEIIGLENPDKKKAAQRVQDDMNYQLTEVMSEYRPEHERMLYSLGLAGAAFKKVYFDPTKQRQVAVYIPAEDVIIPYGATSSDDAERVTHVMRKTPNEVKRLQAKGFYKDVDLGEPVRFMSDIEDKKAKDSGFSVLDDDRYQILEIQADLELPGGDSEDPATDDADRIALPYVVTIERGTGKVLAVRRNWEKGDPLLQKRQHFVQYTYVPGFGAYGLGLIHIIGGYARAGTSIIRQLVDAGTLSNLPGGMKTKGLRTKGDDTPISPGEFRDVDVASGTLRDNIMPLPYKEPSQVLLALLNQITDEGRRLGSIADMQVGDMSANAPVGTTLALLERQLKTMSAVQARVHYSMKQEFKLLKEIIAEYTPDTYSFDPAEGDRKAKKDDYAQVSVIPVSDPNAATMSQRIMQYQAAIQLAQGAPQIYNLPMLHRQMIDVLGIKNADKLIPNADTEDQQPIDPISENMAFITGKPAKAFITQNHDAHIAVHQTMMQDPLVMQQVGQNPMAQQMMAAIQAHISEHVAFQYRQKIQEQLGATLPMPNQPLAPEIESQLSSLVAQAATQLLQINKGNAAQQQAQQQAQDPIIQMQQQELQIKAQEAQTKAKKIQGELALKAQDMQGKQEIAEKKLMVDAQKVGTMGRAQDQSVLAQDRAAAAQLEQQIQQWAATNDLGASHAQHQQQVAQQQQLHQQQMAHQQEAHQQGLQQQAEKAQLQQAIAAQKQSQTGGTE